MHQRLLAAACALALAALPALAQTCNSTSLCPASAPCCSSYGYCGTGEYCLGGCEPLYSHALDSCMPEPICKTQSTDFTDLSRVLLNATAYDGNATAHDWVLSQGALAADPAGQGARLTLTQNGTGTLLSSTRYVHYGQIEWVMQTSKWAGVVSAAITMSDCKDEIDMEWPGTTTDAVQTNYYYLGIANYSATEGASSPISSDSSANFHTYALDWQEDYLSWLIDGTVVRTVNRTDTWDGTSYQYPSTPSRVQISIWAAGTTAYAQGTVDWAGGYIDWTDADYTANGYFWNTLQSVSITCAQDAAVNASSTGYVFSGNASDGTPQVEVTTKSTVSAAARAVGVGRALALAAALGAAGAALL